MPFCAVYGCSNRSTRDKDKKFFSFPSIRDRRGRDLPEGVKRRELWVKALKRDDLTPLKIKNGSVCSDHFLSGYPAQPGDSLNPDYVPSVNIGYVTTASGKISSTSRYARFQKRLKLEEKTKEIEAEVGTSDIVVTPSEAPILDVSQDIPPDILQSHINRQTQTEVVEEDILMHQELYDLRRFKECSTFHRSTFINDDQKTLYFTGIPKYKPLNCIFEQLIEPYIKITPQHAINEKFSHFLITLIKLRLNLDFTLFSYLFNVSIPTISRLFYNTLNVMYYRLKGLVYWPTREELMKTMPQSFKDAFGNKVCVIVDCFEIRIERSRNLATQCATWSSYKHYHTVKVLIGITPKGTISFISQGYGGRITDKAITEDCGILNMLNPGDVVLADRGFLIENLVGLHMAKVITPAFLKGKKQLDPQDIESTRNIAHVRIHVERVIGVLRQKYTILYDIIPMFLAKKKVNNMMCLDEILTVCSALVNLCPSVVS